MDGRGYVRQAACFEPPGFKEKEHAKPYLWAVLTAPFLMAQGSIMCVPRAFIVDSLKANYDEVLVSRGLSTNGTMIEVMAGPKGSWTMLFTRPDGVSCMVLTGEAWQAVEPPPAQQGVDQ